MRATPANMKRLCHTHGQPIAVPGVFAYSYGTDERCSACPGDYFTMSDDDCLTDSDDNDMVLVREIRTVVMVGIDDS